MKNVFLNLPRKQKQLIAAGVDFFFIPLIFLTALALHFDRIHNDILFQFRYLAMAAPLVALPSFVRFGLYRAVIRYIDQIIITAVVVSVTISTFLLGTLATVIYPGHLTISPFLIYWFMTILYVVASRFTARGYFHQRKKDNTRVAIYGAGEAGSHLANAIKPGSEYAPICFVDDDLQRVNTTIGGIPVHHASQIERLAKAKNISAVLLAMPSASLQRQREILNRLAGLSLKIMVTPPISQLVHGRSRLEDVRQIEIEDILSREVVSPDTSLLSVCIKGKSVMVSGAGGSIGSELCRQILSQQPTRLLLLEISEFALYTIEQELRETIARENLDVELVACIGSVLDGEKCSRLMSSFSVETVYHAAAYKHVPLVEHNAVEGIQNNAFGTLSLARAAVAAKVRTFVLISTDKAVRPTNVMGATKRLAELVLQAFARQGSQTRFSMVRFGNVLGSSGSVVPLFRRQIAAGGPVTLTHPDITRYFMTIPEAAQLVLQAGAMGKGGDVFVLDMGAPVRIQDLAERMIRLSGQEVRTNGNPEGIEINYTGLRPGEKLYEELLIGNNVSDTEHPLIMRAEEAEIEWRFLEQMLGQLTDACASGDHPAIRALLGKMVSGYRPLSPIVDHEYCARPPCTTPPVAVHASSPGAVPVWIHEQVQ